MKKSRGRGKKRAQVRAVAATKSAPRFALRSDGIRFVFSNFDACDWSTRDHRHPLPSPSVVDVFAKLVPYEKKTFDEVLTARGNKDHGHHVGEIAPRAQARLKEIGLFDHKDIDDEIIYRFGLNGLPRLWGLRRGNEMFVVWWDPHHQVYPTSR